MQTAAFYLFSRVDCVQKGSWGKRYGTEAEKAVFPGKNFIKFVDNSEKRRIISFCMDTKKECRIVECDTMAETDADKILVGAKQIRKALSAGRAKEVFLAQNADPAITEPIEAQCKSSAVKYVWVKSMSDLGRACGIEVGAAAAARVQ